MVDVENIDEGKPEPMIPNPQLDILKLLDMSSPELQTYVSKLKDGRATTVDNGWSEAKENELQKWNEENQIYCWLLNHEANKYDFYDYLIMIPLIILISSKGIATLGTNSLNEDTIRIFGLVSGCLDMVAGAMALIKLLINPGARSKQLMTISKRYATMSSDFKRILIEDINERPNGTVYLREKNKERNDLFENTPPISSRTWDALYMELEEGKLLDIDTSVLMRKAIITKKTVIKINNPQNQDEPNDNTDVNLNDKIKPINIVTNPDDAIIMINPYQSGTIIETNIDKDNPVDTNEVVKQMELPPNQSGDKASLEIRRRIKGNTIKALYELRNR